VDTVVLYSLSIREHRTLQRDAKADPGYSRKLLVQTLRNLERDGFWNATVSASAAETRNIGSRIMVTSEGADRWL